MLGRACTYLMPSGRPCRATPLRDEPFCFWHSPETAEETLLETVAIETLALENTLARNRTIGGFLSVGAKLIEVGELEERLAVLEAALASRDDGSSDPPGGGLLGG